MAGITIDAEKIKQQVEKKAEEVVRNKCEETQYNLTTLWNHELAQEIAAHSPNESAVEAIAPYVYPKCNVKQDGKQATVTVDCNPGRELHPGLDTLAKIAFSNIITKFKYNRGGESNA